MALVTFRGARSTPAIRAEPNFLPLVESPSSKCNHLKSIRHYPRTRGRNERIRGVNVVRIHVGNSWLRTKVHHLPGTDGRTEGGYERRTQDGPLALTPTPDHLPSIHPLGLGELGGTIRIFHNDSLLAGIAALQHQDHLVGTKKLGHLSLSLSSTGGDWLVRSIWRGRRRSRVK